MTPGGPAVASLAHRGSGLGPGRSPHSEHFLPSGFRKGRDPVRLALGAPPSPAGTPPPMGQCPLIVLLWARGGFILSGRPRRAGAFLPSATHSLCFLPPVRTSTQSSTRSSTEASLVSSTTWPSSSARPPATRPLSPLPIGQFHHRPAGRPISVDPCCLPSASDSSD